MKYNHDVIHNGVYYQAGEEIPQSVSSKEPSKEAPKKEEKPPVKKSRTLNK